MRGVLAAELGGDTAAAEAAPLGSFLFKRPRGGAKMAASRDKRVEAEREVAALSEWRHRHIVRFFGAFRDAEHNVAVLVLENAEGVGDGPLQHTLSQADREQSSAGDCWRYVATRPQLPVWHVKFLAWQALTAVRYLHAEGVVHRDLKTENLLVFRPAAATRRGDVPVLKICDFGSARLVPISAQLGVPDEAGAGGAPRSMTVMSVVKANVHGGRMEKYQGTKQFVAPEIWRAIQAQSGEISRAEVDDVFFGAYGLAADIYSLGVTFYFMALRNYPYPLNVTQRAYENLAIRGSIQWEVVAALVDSGVGEGGEELANFLQRMMHPDPAQRATAAELLASSFFDDVREEATRLFGTEEEPSIK